MFEQDSAESRLEAALAQVAPALQDAGIAVSSVLPQPGRVDLHLEWAPGTCPARIQRALEAARAALRRHLPALNCRLVAPDGRGLDPR